MRSCAGALTLRLSYYIELGRSAYTQAADGVERHAKGLAHLLNRLAVSFVELRDVLQATAQLGGRTLLGPLDAQELWESTGSTVAYQTVRDAADAALPLPAASERRH